MRAKSQRVLGLSLTQQLKGINDQCDVTTQGGFLGYPQGSVSAPVLPMVLR